jgi:hypothetical protein
LRLWNDGLASDWLCSELSKPELNQRRCAFDKAASGHDEHDTQNKTGAVVAAPV